MPIVFIAEGAGTQNNSGYGTYDRHFVSKLILLMLLTFTDALNIPFMNKVNLLSGITVLRKNLFEDGTHGQIETSCYIENLTDYFLMQFGISRISHILFLYGGVDKSCIVMIFGIFVIIHTNTFRNNKLYSFFSDTFAEMNQFGGITRKRKSELLHATKILKTSILTPLLYNRLV